MQAAVCSACKRPVKSSELLAADREMGCVPRSLVRRPVGGGGAKALCCGCSMLIVLPTP